MGHELHAAIVIGHIPGTSRRDLPRSDENRRDLNRRSRRMSCMSAQVKSAHAQDPAYRPTRQGTRVESATVAVLAVTSLAGTWVRSSVVGMRGVPLGGRRMTGGTQCLFGSGPELRPRLNLSFRRDW
jgi:hypothetical protein